MESIIKMQSKVNGDGNPLLLVPGGLTGWQSWEPFVEIFRKKQRQVIQVQLLNVQYGIDNRQLPDGYSVKTENKALAATLDSLNCSVPIDIVAWSYGAFSALDFALDHPELIRTLTLIEPPAVWVLRETGPLDSNTQETTNFFEKLHGEITEDMLEEFLLKVGFAEEGQAVRSLPQWQAWLPFRQSLRNSPAVVDHRDDLKRLKILTQPVFLVKGTGSAKFLHQIIDVLAANLMNSRITEMPAGHAPHIVSKERFLSELEHFQNGISE